MNNSLPFSDQLSGGWIHSAVEVVSEKTMKTTSTSGDIRRPSPASISARSVHQARSGHRDRSARLLGKHIKCEKHIKLGSQSADIMLCLCLAYILH
jgi:hypothetical protein